MKKMNHKDLYKDLYSYYQAFLIFTKKAQMLINTI